jgi:hypothetical protein
MMLVEAEVRRIEIDSPRAAVRLQTVSMKSHRLSPEDAGCVYLAAGPARAAKPPSTILLASVTIQLSPWL